MSQNSDVSSFADIYEHLGSVADECLSRIQTDYGLSGEDAKTLFEHSWIHTYGIATLCATGMCHFTQEEISGMLTQDFTAMIAFRQSTPHFADSTMPKNVSLYAAADEWGLINICLAGAPKKCEKAAGS